MLSPGCAIMRVTRLCWCRTKGSTHDIIRKVSNIEIVLNCFVVYRCIVSVAHLTNIIPVDLVALVALFEVIPSIGFQGNVICMTNCIRMIWIRCKTAGFRILAGITNLVQGIFMRRLPPSLIVSLHNSMRIDELWECWTYTPYTRICKIQIKDMCWGGEETAPVTTACCPEGHWGYSSIYIEYPTSWNGQQKWGRWGGGWQIITDWCPRHAKYCAAVLNGPTNKKQADMKLRVNFFCDRYVLVCEKNDFMTSCSQPRMLRTTLPIAYSSMLAAGCLVWH